MEMHIIPVLVVAFVVGATRLRKPPKIPDVASDSTNKTKKAGSKQWTPQSIRSTITVVRKALLEIRNWVDPKIKDCTDWDIVETVRVMRATGADPVAYYNALHAHLVLLKMMIARSNAGNDPDPPHKGIVGTAHDLAFVTSAFYDAITEADGGET